MEVGTRRDCHVGDIIKEVHVQRDDASSLVDHQADMHGERSWKERCAMAAAETGNVHRWSMHKRAEVEDPIEVHDSISAEEPHKASSSSDTLEDWVLVEDPGPDELRLIPFMRDDHDEDQDLGTV